MRNDNSDVRLEHKILLQGLFVSRLFILPAGYLERGLVSTLDNNRLAIYNLDKMKEMIILFHRIVVEMQGRLDASIAIG